MSIKNSKNDNYMNETMDMRRFFLCVFSKIWMLIVCVVIGAFLGAWAYKAYYAITDGQPRFQRSCDFYITFNEADHPNGMDYYNAYTWGQFLLDDKMIEHVMEFGGKYNEDELKEAVSSRMMSDYRILTVIITGTDKRKIEAIYEAYKFAMPRFANDVEEITDIRVWSEDDMVLVNEHSLASHAAFLGGLIGLLLAMAAFAVYYSMNDRIYTQSDWSKRFPDIAFLGYDIELFSNGNNTDVVSDDDDILFLNWGEHATAAEFLLNEKKNNGVAIKGIKLINCNEKFLKRYYGKA